jgi:enamine deaminase RidA (YjgF/YER057c/UK114 family)
MEEYHITVPEAAAAELASLAEHMVSTAAAAPVAAECFRPCGDDVAPKAAPDIPLTCVIGGPTAPGLGGLHLSGVADGFVTDLRVADRVVGTVVEGAYATEVRLAGLTAEDTTLPLDQQARRTFEMMEEALALVDMDFSHVARTWLYLDDILAWYDDFNRVRTAFFNDRGVFDHLVPASTGIGGANPAGAAMVAGVYAVRAQHPEVTVQAVPSPLQCPAPAYGSSFSRAVEVAMPDLTRLLISGTASIAPGGATSHIGDVKAQTQLTCEVVEAILESRGMGWEHVTRGTAYVRHAKDAGVLEEYRLAAGMPALPVLVAHNVICRDDLLFELEVDAARIND